MNRDTTWCLAEVSLRLYDNSRPIGPTQEARQSESAKARGISRECLPIPVFLQINVEKKFISDDNLVNIPRYTTLDF